MQNNALCENLETCKIWVKHPDQTWLAVPGESPKAAAEKRARQWQQRHPDRQYHVLPIGALPT